MRLNALLGIICFALSEVASSGSPLPISEVVQMSGSGTSPREIIQRIRTSQTSYALRGSDFGKLRAAGVADEVLDYLQQSFVGEVDQLTRRSVTGPRLGGCSYCYPQPVDLDRMVSGFGVASSEVPGRHRPDLPAGVPEWVLPSLSGRKANQVSVPDIVDMARHGVPEAQIVESLRRSRLMSSSKASTIVREYSVADLSGSLFAQWRGEGVSDAVLDAIQGRFLAQLIDWGRLRYQNWL